MFMRLGTVARLEKKADFAWSSRLSVATARSRRNEAKVGKIQHSIFKNMIEASRGRQTRKPVKIRTNTRFCDAPAVR